MVVIGVVFVVAVALKVTSKDETKSDGGVTTADQRVANSETAEYVSDFSVVCEKGSVSNAADYGKPYRIAAFHTGNQDDDWDEITLDHRASYWADRHALSSINVVACLTRKTGSEVKSGTCVYQSAGKDVSVDHYAVEYEIELHQAKTGDAIESLGTVRGPANFCPFIASFDRGSPKIYAAPDDAALEAKLEKFVG